jgi:sirohydrochlorin ferrochelatase
MAISGSHTRESLQRLVGRREHRMEVVMAGRLEEVGRDPIWSSVTIKNISGQGARVISDRSWKAHEYVHLAEPGGERYLHCEVIYCQRLEDNQYAVGLKFAAIESHDAL